MSCWPVLCFVPQRVRGSPVSRAVENSDRQAQDFLFNRRVFDLLYDDAARLSILFNFGLSILAGSFAASPKKASFLRVCDGNLPRFVFMCPFTPLVRIIEAG